MKHYKPMLAKAAPGPFSSEDWIFEVKWDGIRALALINQELSIKSRNQKELKQFFPELKELTTRASNSVLDGEIIVMHEGRADFQKIIKRKTQTHCPTIL